MKSVIIGAGEIGTALMGVLEDYHPVLHDPAIGLIARGEFDIMHVCFPFSPAFVQVVGDYQKQFQPKYTVIHSTVPPGTSRELQAIHSPVIGLHPHLEESLTTFVKYLAGEQASEVADYFRRAGMRVYLFDKPETTELLKILDTTFYGLCIEFTKDVKRLAVEHGIPFEAWTLYTDNYNKGYQVLGYPEYTRPNLTPIMKRIGGHCVLPNTTLLKTRFTEFLRYIQGT